MKRTEKQEYNHQAYLKWKKNRPESYKKHLEKAAKRYEEKKDEIAIYNKKWRQSPNGQQKEKIYHERRKEKYGKKLALKTKKWREDNPEKVKLQNIEHYTRHSSSISNDYLYNNILIGLSKSVADQRVFFLKKAVDKESDNFIFILEIKRLLTMMSRYYNPSKTDKNINKNKLKEDMEAQVIKINELKKTLEGNISNMEKLADIILEALTSYKKGEITVLQLKTYMNASNSAHKVIFSKFIMEQSLIRQFPEVIEIEEVQEEIKE